MNNPLDCLEFLEHPENWQTEICCLKRPRKYGQVPQFAKLSRERLGPPVVIMEALLATMPTNEINPIVQTWTYPNLEAMIADGWLVD